MSSPRGLAQLKEHMLYNDVPASQTQLREELFIVNVFALVGIIAAVLFGLLHIFIEHTPSIGFSLLACGGTMALIMLLLAYTRRAALARHLLLLAILTVLFVMLTTGGIQNTGIFWFFIFPPAAFFLVGKRAGTLWVAALYAGTLLVWGLRSLGLTQVPYSFVTIRQMLATLFVVSFSIFIYQHTRERAQAGKRESESDLQEYLDNMTTLSAKIAPDGTVLFANAVARQASGMNEAVIGANFLEGSWWTYDPAVHQRVNEAFQKAQHGEHVNYDEKIQVRTPKGPRTLVINFSMIPILEGNHLKYVLAEGRDISIELEIDRTKSEFVTLASHQLRTPISAIKWYTEMLLSGDAGRLSHEQHDYVQQVYNSNLRLNAMVDAMLMVSTLELGRLTIRPEPIDLAKLCHRVLIDQLHMQPASKKLEITEHYTKDIPNPMSLDPAIIKTILRNVISNAIKYTPAGGKLSLTIEPSPERLSARSTGSVHIIMSDTGYGIPVDEQKNIFVKLFRAANIRTKDTDGTGLGLFVTKGLLEQVGGRISFVSKEGKGSTFTIVLPKEGMEKHDPLNETRTSKAKKGKANV